MSWQVYPVIQKLLIITCLLIVLHFTMLIILKLLWISEEEKNSDIWIICKQYWNDHWIFKGKKTKIFE